MRAIYSYLRLALACSLFVGGVALQFVPSAAALERDARNRERQLRTVPAEEREEWVRLRDLEGGRAEAALRVFGVLLGGLGLGAALFETAWLCGRFGRPAEGEDPKRG